MNIQGKMRSWWGTVSVSRKSRLLHRMSTLLLAVLMVAVAAAASRAQTTVNAGTVTDAAPGTTALVPISLVLPGGTNCYSIQFKLSVVPGGGAPAISTQVTWDSTSAAAGVGAPSPNLTDGLSGRLVGWLAGFDPLLSGTVVMGGLKVPIPASALGGQTYAVQVLNASGTSDADLNDLPMSGVAGSITVAGAVGPTETPTTAIATATPTTGAAATATPTTGAAATATPTTAPATATQTKGPATVTPTSGPATVTPTGAPATATATKAPATSTPTTAPTVGPGTPTPTPEEDDDGCQIATSGGGSGWLLLIPAATLLVLRRKRR